MKCVAQYTSQKKNNKTKTKQKKILLLSVQKKKKKKGQNKNKKNTLQPHRAQQQNISCAAMEETDLARVPGEYRRESAV